MDIFGKNAGPQFRGKHFVLDYAIETHMDISQEPLHFVRKFSGKCWTPIPRQAFCARLRNRDTHGHFTRAICVKSFRENAGRVWEHLDWTRGLNCYPKNPSVWPHCLGKKKVLTSSHKNARKFPQCRRRKLAPKLDSPEKTISHDLWSIAWALLTWVWTWISLGTWCCVNIGYIIFFTSIELFKMYDSVICVINITQRTCYVYLCEISWMHSGGEQTYGPFTFFGTNKISIYVCSQDKFKELWS